MNLLRNISIPFVPFYYGVTYVRNKLYDSGIKASKSYDFPVICVGNLSVGGTGKTPMIEYLIRLLKTDYCVATLSRGYKRRTKGFILANENASAETIGDEPYQFYNKFKDEIHVAVDANRQEGIAILRTQRPIPEIILLDDAFQHRKVKAGLNILLTTYSNLYVDDFVLPTGNLREPKSGAHRADIIIVTKCPSRLGADEKDNIIKKINPISNQKVFFSRISYAEVLISERSQLNIENLESFTLVTGIANAKPLEDFLNENNLIFEHLNFKDHHQFTADDIKILESKKLIVTTEKDYMRLKQYHALQDKLYYLPIEASIENCKAFDAMIMDFLAKN